MSVFLLVKFHQKDFKAVLSDDGVIQLDDKQFDSLSDFGDYCTDGKLNGAVMDKIIISDGKNQVEYKDIKTNVKGVGQRRLKHLLTLFNENIIKEEQQSFEIKPPKQNYATLDELDDLLTRIENLDLNTTDKIKAAGLLSSLVSKLLNE